MTNSTCVRKGKGKKRILRIYSFVSKIKNIKGHKKIVIAKGSWDDTNFKDVHIFVTNHLSIQVQKMSCVNTYSAEALNVSSEI